LPVHLRAFSVTITKSGNCSRKKQLQIISVMNTQTSVEIGLVSHGQAVPDSQLAVDEILDRFTLALARQMAREDHEKALNERSRLEGQQ
jgi:hypothetical protein